jgi:two-component system chemotaxis response regulator CheY
MAGIASAGRMPPDMAKTRLSIVIAEDNDMMRSLLRAMLRGEEYEVVGEARNGQTAIDMVERLKPDIVCMDVVMPEKSGIEALREIKATRPETEVIMVTGNSDPETVQESIMNGASGFIIKPFNAARVLDTLGKVAARIRQAKR